MIGEARIVRLDNLTLLVIMVGTILSMSIFLPEKFLTVINFQSMASQFPEYGLFAMAIMLTMITGGIDLSVGSIAGFSSITMGMLIVSETMYRDPAALLDLGQNPWVMARAVIGALVIATACGATNGVLIAYAGLPPFIATLLVLATRPLYPRAGPLPAF